MWAMGMHKSSSTRLSLKDRILKERGGPTREMFRKERGEPSLTRRAVYVCKAVTDTVTD